MLKIILTASLNQGEIFKKMLIDVDKSFVNIQCHTKESLVRDLKIFSDVKYIFSTWNMPKFSSGEVKQYFPSLKAIFYAAGTVKYFADPFLKAGIKIYASATENGIPVAEFVVGQVLLSNKGVFQAQKVYKKPFWKFSFLRARSFTNAKAGNYNATIGIIGCGAIGSKIISLLKPYHLNVVVYDPFLSKQQLDELGVQHVSIEELFRSCDVISNHLPDIPSTKGIINKKLLSLLKSTATFINTGRGNQLEEKDLCDVMKNKPMATALLDVTQKEPIRPWSPLLRTKNIFLTPHIAGSTSNEVKRLVERANTSYKNFINNIDDVNEVKIEQIHTKT